MQIVRIILSASLALLPLTAARAFELALIPSKIYNKGFEDGDISWALLVQLILHWIQLLVTLAGGIAVILLMIAGAQYTMGKLIDDNEGGKNTIRNTLLGLVVIVLAWYIVDILIAFLTTGN